MVPAPALEPIIELRNVHAGYQHISVLRDVSLVVGAGQVVTVIGANGAGKTTTLNVISGVVPVSLGEVRLDGEVIRPRGSVMVSRGIAHCPEGRRMFPHMTVRENLETGAYTVKNAAKISESLDRAFAMFPILAERASQKAGTLSGGEQQMAAVARALMSDPRLLLLDEPTLGLSPKLVSTVREIIATIASTGLAILLVEQNARMALDLADYGYVFETGSVIIEGPAAELRENNRVRDAYLSAA